MRFHPSDRGCAANLSAAILFGLIWHASDAQADPPNGAAARYVGIFDAACLEPMPDLGAVAALAQDRAWTPVTGDALAAYKPPVPPTSIAAWTLQDDGQNLSVSVTQSDLDDQAKSDFPDFADGQSYACSVVLPPDRTKPDDITAALTALLTRPQDTSYDEDPWTVIHWSAVTPERTVLVYHYRPRTGQAGGLLSLVMFEKD